MLQDLKWSAVGAVVRAFQACGPANENATSWRVYGLIDLWG